MPSDMIKRLNEEKASAYRRFIWRRVSVAMIFIGAILVGSSLIFKAAPNFGLQIFGHHGAWQIVVALGVIGLGFWILSRVQED